MKRPQKKDNTLAIAAFCLVATILIVFFAFFLKPAKKWFNNIMGSNQSAASVSAGLAVDVTEAAMMEYVGAVAGNAPIHIRIVETTDEFTVSSLSGAATYQKQVDFKVLPTDAYRFAAIPIEKLVREGLKEVSSPEADHPFLWRGVVIATNKADAAWTVSVTGIEGEGSLGLTVGKASATCRVNLPKLFPIWKEIVYVSPIREEVHVGGVRSPTRNTTIAPDLRTGYCGFRVRAVVGQSVWFEVLYDGRSPGRMRKRWPALAVDFDVRENGGGFSSVKFEGGKVMAAGDEAVFGDDLTVLKLDGTGFLGSNAVLFRYLDAERRPICDMLCVTLQR